MTKGDIYTKEILQRILDEGCMDVNPRPHYEDGTPAHTLSVNHGMCTYDLTKGESPLITLRPIAVKSSIGELLWIYQDESNDLNVLRDKSIVDLQKNNEKLLKKRKFLTFFYTKKRISRNRAGIRQEK